MEMEGDEEGEFGVFGQPGSLLVEVVGKVRKRERRRCYRHIEVMEG
jgi:hypothetical protein